MIKKTFWNVGIERTHLNITRTTYDKPTANNFILKGENLLRSRTRQGYPFSPLLANIALEVLPTHGNHRIKRNRSNPNEKKRNKCVSVCR